MWRRWQRWCSSDRAGHGGRVAGFGVWACARSSDVGGSGGDCARHGRHAPPQPTASAFTVTAPFPAEAPELRRRQLWPSPSSATAYPCVAPCRPLLERHQRRRSPRSAGARRTSLQGQLRRRAFTQLLRSCPRRACRRGSHALHTSTCVFNKWSAAFLNGARLATPLYGDYLQRAQAGTVDNASTLKHRSTFGRADVDVLVEHLASVSDLSAEQICAIYERNQDSIKQMIEADTGLPPSMTIDPKLHVRVAFLRFLKLLSGRCGSPLRNIRERCGVTPSLSLDWNECGAYVFELSEDGAVIAKVSFRNGDVGDLTGEVISVTSWKVR